MLYDSLVAVDILAALPEVDAARIGCVGHSLGAKETLYLAAFDERVKATVSSEGGIGTKFSNWDAAWYLGPSIKEPSFTHEHHELLALAAPRPVLARRRQLGRRRPRLAVHRRRPCPSMSCTASPPASANSTTAKATPSRPKRKRGSKSGC